jgi:ubiquitin-protein ligase
VQTSEESRNSKLQISDDDRNHNSIETALNDETLDICDNDGSEREAVRKAAVLHLQSQSNVPNATYNQLMDAQESVTHSIEEHTKNKKKRTSMQKQNTSKVNASSSTGKEGECLRRIRHEWKDAVKMGIAYDWINMKTIHKTNTNSSSSSAYVRIGPFGKNLLRWHFSVVGPKNSVYDNGIYHGRVLLPKDYPASPPRVQMITPSGRFIPGEDICLSASSYHPETWTPRWTVLSLVDALRLHMLTTANEIGGVLASEEKRRQYALASRSWKCNGIANHERMVAENTFVLDRLDDYNDKNFCVEEKRPPMEFIGNSSCESSELLDIQEEDLKCEIHDAHSSKETVDDPSNPGIHKKESSKHVKSVKKKKKKTKKPKDLKVPTTSHLATAKHLPKNDNHNIVTIVLKKLLVEILKLPLRVLATTLRFLDRLEKYLRAILDSI